MSPYPPPLARVHGSPDRLLLVIPIAGIGVGWAWNQYGLAGALGALHVIALVEALRKRLLRDLGRRDRRAYAVHIALPASSAATADVATGPQPTPAPPPPAATVWMTRAGVPPSRNGRFRI